MPLKDFQAGSSPLSSRANPVIYAVLIVAAVIIFIAFLIWSALKILKKYRTSDKYIESQKNKISSYADIKNFCAKFKLPQKEQNYNPPSPAFIAEHSIVFSHTVITIGTMPASYYKYFLYDKRLRKFKQIF